MKTRHIILNGLMVMALMMGLTQAVLPNVVASPFSDPDSGKACTTVIVGKQASADGSVLMSHEEDYAANDAMKLVHHPRQNHQLGEVIHFAFEDVPQVPETYAYTADEMYDPARLGGAFRLGDKLLLHNLKQKQSSPTLYPVDQV